MKKVDKIWLDGKLVDWKDAKVHVLVNALHYGSAVFEGIRCYETDHGGAVFRLPEHIDRLFYSASCLGIKTGFSKDQISKAIIDLVKINKIKECYVRPLIFCGEGNLGLNISSIPTSVAVAVWPWGSLLGGKESSAIISSYRRLSPRSAPIDAKVSGYYANSIIASAEAKKKGADEAILLDDDGYIAEGAGENIFIVRNSKIYTPAKGAILPGITRDSVIQIAKDIDVKVIEKKISVDELKNADEVFFTGTAVEVCPVVKINNHKVGNGISGSITLRIKEEYSKTVRGQNKKYKKWLTVI